jgi:hypothetical protein
MVNDMTSTTVRKSPTRVLAARRTANRRRQLVGDFLVVLVWASAALSVGLYFASF